MLKDYLFEPDITISEDEVLRYLGYRAKVKSQEIGLIVSREIAGAYQVIKPRAIFSIKDVISYGKNGVVKLDNGVEFNVGGDATEWQGLQHLAIVICTIGNILEEQVDRLFAQGDPLRALILDAAGSTAVEAVADEVNLLICKEQKGKGRQVAARSSPGYGKWNLEEQKLFFSLLPAYEINVKLNEQCMMLPRKSCSFCLAIGDKLAIVLNPCRRCGKKDCH